MELLLLLLSPCPCPPLEEEEEEEGWGPGITERPTHLNRTRYDVKLVQLVLAVTT